MLLKSMEDGRINICSNIEKPIHNENLWFSLLKEMYHKKKQIRRFQILTHMFQCPELKVAQGSQAKERTCSRFQKKKKENSSYFGPGWSFLSSKMFLRKVLKPHYRAKRNGKELAYLNSLRISLWNSQMDWHRSTWCNLQGKKGKALSFLSSRIISHIRDKNYTLGL